MKKKILVFINYFFVFLILINNFSCKWWFNNNDDWNDENTQDISCNYIVPNINKRTNKIISDRLIFGEDSSSLRKWYLNNSESWFYKNPKNFKFIKNLEEKIMYKADNKSINDFNNLEKQKNFFNDFDDLQKKINNTYLNINEKVNINFEIFFKKIKLNQIDINKIKKEILRFYNIVSKVYGKNNLLKLIYKINYKKFLQNIIAQTKSWKFLKFENNYGYYLNCIQVIGLSELVFCEKIAINNYFFGFWSSKSIIQSLVHEYGHALSNFLSLNSKGRKNINYFVDNKLDSPWNIYFSKSLTKLQNNKKINNLNFKNEYLINPEKYMILSLARDTKINNPIYQKLLSYAIVRSNYGRISNEELFAEGFAQWIETPENQKNVAWEKLDKFFRIDLPKIL